MTDSPAFDLAGLLVILFLLAWAEASSLSRPRA